MARWQNLTVLGAGKMGGMIVRSVLAAGMCEPASVRVFDIDRSRTDALVASHGVREATDATEAVRGAHLVLLAVLPQQMAELLDQTGPAIEAEQLVISIAPGIRAETIEAACGPRTRVVRVMPNMPLLVGAGMSAVARGANATEADTAMVVEIFQELGEAIPFEEKDLDAVTGLSGSGPAYIFLVLEGLADGGVKMGLPRDLSIRLAAQTILGAAQLVLTDGEHPAILRERVTSPGGTTTAGLFELESRGVRPALAAAVEAATRRAAELG